MGDNTISSATDNFPIPASHNNGLRSAMIGNNVPRNSNGVVEDQSGSIGTSSLSWISGYIRKIFIGDPNNNNSIDEVDGNIVFKDNGNVVSTINSGGIIGLQENAVITASILDLSVTRPKLFGVGQVISTSSGLFSTSSLTFVDIDNLSVSINTTGRPVSIGLISDDSGTSYIGVATTLVLGVKVEALFRLLRETTVIMTSNVCISGNTSYTDINNIPVSSISHIDVISSGFHTYKLQVRVSDIGYASAIGARLIAREL